MANAFAAGLLKLGLSPGDRFAIWGYNSSQWYIAYLAAASIGIITVKLNPVLEGPELVEYLTRVDARVILCAERHHETVKKTVPHLTAIVMSKQHHGDAHRFDDIMKDASPAMLKDVEKLKKSVQPDDGCDIIFTSGTTGSSKAALLSQHAVLNNTRNNATRMGIHLQTHRWCVTTQFCHATASIHGILSCLHFGATLVLPSEEYCAEDIVNTLQQERCTAMMAIPSQMVDIVDIAAAKGIALPDMKVICIGGAPVSSALVYAIQSTVPSTKIQAMLGMTETSGLTFMSLFEDSVEKVASTTGYAMDHMELKIVDSDGRMVPMGTPGELWVRGYNTMKGYWGQEDKTREIVRPDGWLKTGDQLVMTEDGYGRIVGRLKEMIIRENQNIFPSEIEQFLQGHPHILDVQAFGVPDPRVGEEMCAFIRPKNDVTITEQDVRDYCTGKLAEWKIPRYILFAETFPRSVTGKVVKKELQQMALEKLGLKKAKNLVYIPQLQGPSVQ